MNEAARAIVVLLWAGASACGAGAGSTGTPPAADASSSDRAPIPNSPKPAERPAGTVALGEGLDRFLGLRDGQTIHVHIGPQGGHMLFLASRTAGLDPGDAHLPDGPVNPTTRFGASLAGVSLGEAMTRQGYVATSSTADLLGIILILDPGVELKALYGSKIEVEVDVQDRAQKSASASALLTAQPATDP